MTLTAEDIEAAGGLQAALAALKPDVTNVYLPEGTFNENIVVPEGVTIHGI